MNEWMNDSFLFFHVKCFLYRFFRLQRTFCVHQKVEPWLLLLLLLLLKQKQNNKRKEKTKSEWETHLPLSEIHTWFWYRREHQRPNGHWFSLRINGNAISSSWLLRCSWFSITTRELYSIDLYCCNDSVSLLLPCMCTVRSVHNAHVPFAHFNNRFIRAFYLYKYFIYFMHIFMWICSVLVSVFILTYK